MLLPADKAQAMRRAIENETKQALENGDYLAVGEDGTEYEFRWEDGQAKVSSEGDCEEDEPRVEYTFAIRVELVSVDYN